MNEDELYQRIVTKYPSYAHISQGELMPKIYAKHPQYQQAVKSEPEGFGLAGPITSGVDYVRKGLSSKDIPYVGAKMGSEFLGGIPEMASKKPLISSAAGPFGAISGKDEGANMFPKPSSEGGRLAGRDLGLVAGMADPALALSGAKGMIAEPVQKFGVRLMQGILKPKGELAEKGTQIAERALQEGLVGTKEGMLNKVYGLLQEGGKDIGKIIEKAKGKTVDMNTVFSELRDLRKKYSFAQNEKKVAVIDNLMEQFKPAFKEPKTVRYNTDVGGTFDPNTAEYTPNTQRVTRTQSVNRPVPIEEAQARKVAQYQDLAEGKPYPLEASSPEVAGRKAYARGFMKATEDVVPEIGPANKRFGGLTDVAQTLEERLPVEQRQQLFGMGDVIFGAAGTVSPTAMTAGVLRKSLQATPVTSRIARGAYRFGRGANPSSSLAYPLARYFGDSGE